MFVTIGEKIQWKSMETEIVTNILHSIISRSTQERKSKRFGTRVITD